MGRAGSQLAFFTTEVNELSDTRTGVLVEYDVTDKMFSNPTDERIGELCHRPIRLITRVPCA